MLYDGAVARSYLVLDIETVPDRDLWEPPEAPAADRALPPIYAHRIVVMGAMWLDEAYALKKLGVFDEKTPEERDLLHEFSAFMDKQRPDLITFNGRTFDLPVILQRCLRHGVAMPWYYEKRPEYRYRYRLDGHMDLCDLLSEHGAARMISLDAAARLIGLPGKGDLDGSQVEGLFRGGQIDTLRGYCLSDVVQTAFLALRVRHMMGALDLAGYRRAAGGLYDALKDDARVAATLAAADADRLLLR